MLKACSSQSSSTGDRVGNTSKKVPVQPLHFDMDFAATIAQTPTHSIADKLINDEGDPATPLRPEQ